MSNGDELGSRGARRIRRVRNPTPIDVFEHGIVIADGDPPNGLARVATTREPIYSGYTITIVDRDGSSLNHRANHLVDVPGPYQTSDLWDEHNVTYCLRSALYRLDRMIGMYADHTRHWEETQRDAIRGNTGDSRIYFEVDAFLGAARRVYDSISKCCGSTTSGRPKVDGDRYANWSNRRQTWR